MKVTMGERELELGGKYLTELRSSNDIFDDTEALRGRMAEDGYLLIRGFHDREDVLAARMAYLAKVEEKGLLAPGTKPEDGIVGPENKGAFFGFDFAPDELLKLVNSVPIMRFFDRFLGGDTLTYDHKWSRVVGSGHNTGAHYDVVYMGRGTKNVYTVWTPIGDVPVEMGTLALCLGSQHFDRIKQTYGQMDVDRDHVTGWFSNDPVDIVDKFGGRWGTTDFAAGDILIFGMFMMHASLSNATDRYRISADTRYQLASEPVDERWYGKNPRGHYAWFEGKTVPMEEARKSWGI